MKEIMKALDVVKYLITLNNEKYNKETIDISKSKIQNLLYEELI